MSNALEAAENGHRTLWDIVRESEARARADEERWMALRAAECAQARPCRNDGRPVLRVLDGGKR